MTSTPVFPIGEISKMPKTHCYHMFLLTVNIETVEEASEERMSPKLRAYFISSASDFFFSLKFQSQFVRLEGRVWRISPMTRTEIFHPPNPNLHSSII